MSTDQPVTRRRASAAEPLITRNPDVMSGQAVFRGTRLPVEVLFENLADGLSLGEIISSYPTLSREDAVAVLEDACRRLTAS